MFDKYYLPPKYVPSRRPKHMTHDIQLPCLEPDKYGHMARRLNTDYHVRLLQYRQRTQNIGDVAIESEKKQLAKDVTDIKYNTHAEKKRLQGQIRDRFNEKVKNYEASIDVRREKLRLLLAKDEHEFYHVTIDKAQRGADKRMEQMKERAQMLRAQREAQRVQIVREKRVQQYKDRCMELRPHLAQKHLKDTKDTQLQQMRENESRREAEREIEKMWEVMMSKEMEAKVEREKQDLIHEDNRRRDLLDTWNMQIQGKELLKQEADKVAEEDRQEMLKLQDQLKREKLAGLEKQKTDRESWSKDLREQIELQQMLMNQRRKEEEALDQAIAKLNQIEIQREKDAIQDTSLQARREMMQYRNHLRELEEQRKIQEQELVKMLEDYQKIILQKQLEAKCKHEEARRKLQEEVLRGRAEQLEYKKNAADLASKQRQEENNAIEMTFETNRRLKLEQVRRTAEEAKKYRDDLKKQIEYNELLRQRELEEANRQIKIGLEEEEKYRTMVDDFLKGRLYEEERHPFRRVLDRFDCHCPNTSKN